MLYDFKFNALFIDNVLLYKFSSFKCSDLHIMVIDLFYFINILNKSISHGKGCRKFSLDMTQGDLMWSLILFVLSKQDVPHDIDRFGLRESFKVLHQCFHGHLNLCPGKASRCVAS